MMRKEIYESAMHRISVYKDIELSERQIEKGQVKDARIALAVMCEKINMEKQRYNNAKHT